MAANVMPHSFEELAGTELTARVPWDHRGVAESRLR
jgi:hypothetical protein